MVGAGSWTNLETDYTASAREYTKSGLTATTDYEFRIRASDTGGDSSYVESNDFYTWPAATGWFWAAYPDTTATAWTHLAEVVRATPFLDINLMPLAEGNSMHYNADPEDILFGDELSVPSWIYTA